MQLLIRWARRRQSAIWARGLPDLQLPQRSRDSGCHRSIRRASDRRECLSLAPAGKHVEELATFNDCGLRQEAPEVNAPSCSCIGKIRG